MNVNRKQSGIPVHHLTNYPFLVFTVESTNDETFDGLHRHDFYELIWFTKIDPNEPVEIDFVPYLLKEDEVCLLSPGQVFRMTKTLQEGYVMAFSKELFYQLVDNPFVVESTELPISLDIDALEAVKTLTSLILKEYNHQKRMALLNPYLSAFLFHIITSMAGRQKATDSRISELLQLVDRHYLQQREATFYADQLHIGGKHLNALVKKERGTTVKELILQRVILEAKREINFGKLSFKEIAFKLGFNDPAYFSRFFKVQTGMRAEQFKASVQKS